MLDKLKNLGGWGAIVLIVVASLVSSLVVSIYEAIQGSTFSLSLDILWVVAPATLLAAVVKGWWQDRNKDSSAARVLYRTIVGALCIIALAMPVLGIDLLKEVSTSVREVSQGYVKSQIDPASGWNFDEKGVARTMMDPVNEEVFEKAHGKEVNPHVCLTAAEATKKEVAMVADPALAKKRRCLSPTTGNLLVPTTAEVAERNRLSTITKENLSTISESKAAGWVEETIGMPFWFLVALAATGVGLVIWLARRKPSGSPGVSPTAIVFIAIVVGLTGVGIANRDKIGGLFAREKLSPNGCRSLGVFIKHYQIVHQEKKCFFITTNDESVKVMFSPFSTNYRLEFTFMNPDSKMLKGRAVSSLLNIASVPGAISTYRNVSPNVRALSTSGLGIVEVMVYAVPL